MTVVSEPECIWEVGAELGEGALWSAREDAVWFVDIKKRKIHRLADGQQRSWDSPQQVGFILPAADGGWVAGLQMLRLGGSVNTVGSSIERWEADGGSALYTFDAARSLGDALRVWPASA